MEAKPKNTISAISASVIYAMEEVAKQTKERANKNVFMVLNISSGAS
jgi:hypothetical protein